MKKIFLLVVVVIVSCCESKVETNTIKKYLEDDLNVSFVKDELYILFPTYGMCGTFQKLTQDFLLKQPGMHKEIHLIYIGNSKKELQFYSKGLNERFDVKYDSKNIGVKKSIVNLYPTVIVPNIDGNKQYEFSTKEYIEIMKGDVSDFIANKPLK